MGKRILVAVIFIPLLLVLIYGIAPAYPWALCLLVAGLSMISVHEVLWSTGFLKHARISGYSIVLAGLIPFWVYYDGESLPALCGLFVYVVLLFAEAIAAHKRISLEKLGGAFFLSIVIPFFLSSFLRIRQMEHWQYLILLPLEAAFLSDAFALFAGMAFGKHKLAPELSPKKTVEGAVGGFAGAVVWRRAPVRLPGAGELSVSGRLRRTGQRGLPAGGSGLFLYQAGVRAQGFRQYSARTRRHPGSV